MRLAKQNRVKVFCSVVMLVCMMCFGVNAQNYWSKYLPSIGTFSSARAADLNSDGTMDLIFGAGRQEFQSCDTAVVAFNGVSGELLWTASAEDQIFGSSLLIDINNDQIEDVIIGGRSAELIALDGVSGDVVWRFKDVNLPKEIENILLFNFYNPQLVGDLDGDGISDLLVSNGGDVMAEAFDSNRPVGSLILVSAKTGKYISHANMPDGRETYMSVSVNLGMDNPEIVFGTGGETIGGSLYVAKLSNVLSKDLSKATKLHTSQNKGYIAPVVRVDITRDGILDIVANSVDGRLVLIDGEDFSIVWELSLPETEAYSMPCIGYFNGDNVPDIFISFGKGIWPNIEWSIQKMVSGATGQVEYTDSLGYYQSSSPVSVDLNGDGIDEVIMSLNFQGKDSLDQSIMQNALVAIEFISKEAIYLSNLNDGANLATTPWIGDLDDDGFLDFVYSHSVKPYSFKYNFDGIKIHRLTTEIPIYDKVRWGAYQGSQYDGIFKTKLQPK